MYATEDSLWPTVFGLTVAAGAKYLSDSWQKAHPGKWFPQVIGAGVGAIGMIARSKVANPYANSAMELAGATLFAGNLGDMVASNTVTLGNIASGNIPTMHVQTAASGLGLRNRGAAPVVYPPVVQPSLWNPWQELPSQS